MADGTRIEWATTTWSPITGCSKISAGCKNCYAERMSKRLAGRFGYPADEPFKVVAHLDKLFRPSRWRKPRRVFVCSMGDLFHHDVTYPDLEKIFQVMLRYENRKHTFILLTKRAQRMHNFIRACYPGLDRCAPHIWGLVTAENQEQADKRIPWLLKTPFAVRGVSVEPMLGAVDLTYPPSIWPNGPDYCCNGADCGCRGMPIEPPLMGSNSGAWIDWVICGAETGPGARPMSLDCARALRDQCQATGTPFFFKRDSDGNRTLDGVMHEQYPETAGQKDRFLFWGE